MDNIEEKLKEMGLALPEPFAYPSSNRTGCVLTGKLLYISGHPPPADFGITVHGKVGDTVSEEEAVAASSPQKQRQMERQRRRRRQMESQKQKQ